MAITFSVACRGFGRILKATAKFDFYPGPQPAYETKKPHKQELLRNAAGRTRTGTAVNRLILSQVRLPIPPQRLINFEP